MVRREVLRTLAHDPAWLVLDYLTSAQPEGNGVRRQSGTRYGAPALYSGAAMGFSGRPNGSPQIPSSPGTFHCTELA